MMSSKPGSGAITLSSKSGGEVQATQSASRGSSRVQVAKDTRIRKQVRVKKKNVKEGSEINTAWKSQTQKQASNISQNLCEDVLLYRVHSQMKNSCVQLATCMCGFVVHPGG